jgi:hypothetical protein
LIAIKTEAKTPLDRAKGLFRSRNFDLWLLSYALGSQSAIACIATKAEVQRCAANCAYGRYEPKGQCGSQCAHFASRQQTVIRGNITLDSDLVFNTALLSTSKLRCVPQRTLSRSE